jgi:hypothetical protein
MGHTPLENAEEINEIREWLTQRDLNRLADISSWDASGNWLAWNLPETPVYLQHQKALLIKLLSDLAPVHLRASDTWGWGKTGSYTAAQGYNFLQSLQPMADSTALWKQVWDPMGLPKVNFFFWTLMHKKTLTGENLINRGIDGPHRCPLCCNAIETMDHLFVDCPFAQEAWKFTLNGLNVTAPSQITVTALYSSWKARYSHEMQSKSTGRQYPNIYTGKSGWQETTRSSITSPILP